MRIELSIFKLSVLRAWITLQKRIHMDILYICFSNLTNLFSIHEFSMIDFVIKEFQKKNSQSVHLNLLFS